MTRKLENTKSLKDNLEMGSIVYSVPTSDTFNK